MSEEEKKKKMKRGLASMDPAKKREISSKGGKAAQASGKAYRWTSEKAKEAGRRGGLISRRRRKEPNYPDGAA